jgi:protocatechuate 3,4-dioxygenase beta subunit
MRTPEQILGPYFPMQIKPMARGDLTKLDSGSEAAQGEIVQIGGRIRNLEGEPVCGARILIWQANSFGRYTHPNDLTQAPLDPNFHGFAEIVSDSSGAYTFRTIKPGAYPAIADWMRAPHVHFEVSGHFERLITQMYFPDDPLNASDRFLMTVRQPDLLIAQPVPSESNSDGHELRFDIVLARG